MSNEHVRASDTLNAQLPTAQDIAKCVAATLAHHRAIAVAELDPCDEALQYPLTVRRAQRTIVCSSAEEYISETLSYRGGILGEKLLAESKVEDTFSCGPSIILVRARSYRLKSPGVYLSSLGFSHVHLRSGDTWKISAIMTDDVAVDMNDT